ncbi:hypothetical protein JVT61DRAFT_12158 [Boletus reticuloceps]|uniref:DUF8190 domain-containing protein n=1 Tax=Boletus reticuloceps TaxID=495285 RepID=A0A8I2YEB9_9AGAM|nr:hypothetical protein JVT61DRAFT_12158 [Boletus reticuloceps]
MMLKNYCAAVSILKQCSPIVINHHLSTTDDHIIPCIQGHFVDFALYLGSRLSLDALFPSPLAQQDHTWHVNLTFSNLFKQWPKTHTSLPFSITGHMLYVGSRAQEEIWLAFIPNALLEQPDALPDMTLLAAAHGQSFTSMSLSVYRPCLHGGHVLRIYLLWDAFSGHPLK